MDPESTIVSAFQAAPNLAEIWPFPINALSSDNQNQHIPINHHLQHIKNHAARKRRDDDESAKGVSTSGNALNESDNKRLKATRSNENQEYSGGGNSGKSTDQPAKPSAEPPKDYIHVRARRGQATDSHSLAERARREKISERMKILQDLVPGCNKVIGKALILDEIINYVQSLQCQVEFLSMKLEAVNTRVTPTIEGIPTKDFGQETFETNGMTFGSQGTREYAGGTSPDWLHMQIGGGFERTT